MAAQKLTKKQMAALMSLEFKEPFHPEDLGVSRSVLNRLAAYGLAVKIKCVHRYGNGSFIGFALSDEGLRVRAEQRGMPGVCDDS